MQRQLLSSPKKGASKTDLVEAVKRKHLKAEIKELNAHIEQIHSQHKKRAVPDGKSYSFTWLQALGYGLSDQQKARVNLGLKLVRVRKESRFVSVEFIAPDAPPELQNIIGWTLRAVIGKEKKIPVKKGTDLDVRSALCFGVRFFPVALCCSCVEMFTVSVLLSHRQWKSSLVKQDTPSLSNSRY